MFGNHGYLLDGQEACVRAGVPFTSFGKNRSAADVFTYPKYPRRQMRGVGLIKWTRIFWNLPFFAPISILDIPEG